MKRSLSEIIRRGFANTFANWELLAISVAETILYVAVTIGGVVAFGIPILVSAGLGNFKLEDAGNIAENIVAIVSRNVMLVVYLLVVVMVVLTLFVVVHSLVEAGKARIYADADVAAGVREDRKSFRAFSIDRWMDGARASFWSVFWVYNIIWTAVAAILLLPALGGLALMLLLHTPALMAGIGCLTLLLLVMLLFAAGFVATILVRRSVMVAVVQDVSAGEAIGQAWSAMKSDPGRHFLLGLLFLAISMALSGIFGGAGFGLNSISHTRGLVLAFLPVRMVLSTIEAAIGSIAGAWFLAAMAALTLEKQTTEK